jgi:rhamnulose-1-phosphate aldolase
MKVFDSRFAKEFMRMCYDGWVKGWHEFHAGNLSYRLTDSEAEDVKEEFTYNRPWTKMAISVPALAGEHIAVTGSGNCFRDIEVIPEDSFGIIEIGDDGEQYRVVWGLADGRSPTSELPAHLASLEIKKKVTSGKHRIVYHAHPANIIALSFVLELTDTVFTKELWEMEPECAMTFPQGLGVIPWIMPGSAESAEETRAKLKEFDAILWAQHGIFVSGKDFADTFGLADTIEKAAEILVKVRSMAGTKRQAPTSENLKNLSKVFKLSLPEKYLK